MLINICHTHHAPVRINSDITIDIISDIISDHAHAEHMTSCDHCVTIVFSKYQLIYININGCL